MNAPKDPAENMNRLKIQQILDRQEALDDRLKGLEAAVEELKESKGPAHRVTGRMDAIELHINSIIDGLHTQGELLHRHVDPLPFDSKEAIPFFPPGCAEMCWKKCQCRVLQYEAHKELAPDEGAPENLINPKEENSGKEES